MSETLMPAEVRATQEALRKGLGLETPCVGALAAYAGTAVPSGFLRCNGQAVSRQQYTRLFGVIGTTFGAGDGTTTFNVPTIAAPAFNTMWIIRS